MLIATNIPPIAEWDFLLAGEALATPLSVWVERSCAVLARHRLLTVERVIAWGSTRVERGRATSEGMAALLGAVEADLGGPPREIWAIGSGSVFTADGREYVGPDVTRLGVYDLAGQRVVFVATWCDAWMPADLFARAQPDVHRQNAPRLRRALEELEALLGCRGDGAETHALADPRGYELTNQETYDDKAADLRGLVEVVAELP